MPAINEAYLEPNKNSTSKSRQPSVFNRSRLSVLHQTVQEIVPAVDKVESKPIRSLKY